MGAKSSNDASCQSPGVLNQAHSLQYLHSGFSRAIFWRGPRAEMGHDDQVMSSIRMLLAYKSNCSPSPCQIREGIDSVLAKVFFYLFICIVSRSRKQ